MPIEHVICYLQLQHDYVNTNIIYLNTFLSKVILRFYRINFRRCNLFELLPLPLSGNEGNELDHSQLQCLVSGYEQLHVTGILMSALEKEVKHMTIFIPCKPTLSHTSAILHYLGDPTLCTS